MRKKELTGLVILCLLLVFAGLTGCAKDTYFGVRNKAIGAPDEFAATEAAIEKAERSPGAQYAPEKIAKTAAPRDLDAANRERWGSHLNY